MVEDVNIVVQSFETADGGQTIQVSPSGSRRQKHNWYIWVKPDGSGILVIDSQKKRVNLPANGPIKKFCDDSACPLLNMSEHEFGKGCRLFQD